MRHILEVDPQRADPVDLRQSVVVLPLHIREEDAPAALALVSTNGDVHVPRTARLRSAKDDRRKRRGRL